MLRDIKNIYIYIYISHILNGYIETDHQHFFLTMVENVLEKKYVEAYPELHQEEYETTSQMSDSP